MPLKTKNVIVYIRVWQRDNKIGLGFTACLFVVYPDIAKGDALRF